MTEKRPHPLQSALTGLTARHMLPTPFTFSQLKQMAYLLDWFSSLMLKHRLFDVIWYCSGDEVFSDDLLVQLHLLEGVGQREVLQKGQKVTVYTLAPSAEVADPPELAPIFKTLQNVTQNLDDAGVAQLIANTTPVKETGSFQKMPLLKLAHMRETRQGTDPV